jgi:multisubunit Na+/H+ antiporter MnhB subunit
MPPSVRGLTLVMCERNSFMMGQNGMNIGGISALMNAILIDYTNARVGLKPK